MKVRRNSQDLFMLSGSFESFERVTQITSYRASRFCYSTSSRPTPLCYSTPESFGSADSPASSQ